MSFTTYKLFVKKILLLNPPNVINYSQMENLRVGVKLVEEVVRLLL